MAEKFSGVRSVSAVAVEMRNAIIKLAGERGWFDTRERWLENAARKAGISARSAKALFYGEVSDPRYSIVESVRRALAQTQTDAAQKAVNDATEARNELLDRLAKVERALALHQADADREVGSRKS